jgi:hypothetical protein
VVHAGRIVFDGAPAAAVDHYHALSAASLESPAVKSPAVKSP